MVIVQDGTPVLRQKAALVKKGDFDTPALRKELRAMEAALDAEADGVALAAPQIGVSRRIFIVRYDRMGPEPEEGKKSEPDIGIYINPEITKRSRKRAEKDEGCLSVRGTYGKILRNVRATVRAYDEHGVPFERGAGGLLAQAFQHEIDHLDGILFIDTATELREVALEDRPKRSRAQEGWKLDEHE